MSSTNLWVSVRNLNPRKLLIWSSIPITCDSVSQLSGSCNLQLTVITTDGIAVRQQYSGLTLSPSCSYLLPESDWERQGNSYWLSRATAYLDVLAKANTFYTPYQLNWIQFSVGNLGSKTVNGETYPNPWNGYVENRRVRVQRFGGWRSFASCISTGDPRVFTFDYVQYSIYSFGQFIYVRSVNSTPFEIQIRHWPCTRAVVACVCGVAVREDNTILAADMCTSNDSVTHYITYTNGLLPNGARITRTPGGSKFQILMPSGNRVLGNIFSWGMNIEFYISKNMQTEGLCGSIDGNRNNDLQIRNTATFVTGQPSNIEPADVVRSWRVQSNESLFEGYLAPFLNIGSPSSPTLSTNFCSCNETNPVCGAAAVTNPDSPVPRWEPRTPVTPRVPLLAPRNRIIRTRTRRQATDMGGEISDGDPTYKSRYTKEEERDIRPRWPSPGGTTESQAQIGCRAEILNVIYLGRACLNLTSTAATDRVIAQCMEDVQLTDDFQQSGRDRVTVVQNICRNEAIARANSNNTEQDSQGMSLFSEVGQYICEPYDCNCPRNAEGTFLGICKGVCRNALCVCNAGYIGPTCNVLQSQPPRINGLVDPVNCNIRERPCTTVLMRTFNAIPDCVCQIEITTWANTVRTVTTEGDRQDPGTSRCRLPEATKAMQTYKMTISNDATSFSNTAIMRVFDGLCLQCDEGCSQKNNTCLISEQCYAANSFNPTDLTLKCIPSMSNSSWSSAISTSAPPTTAAVIGGSVGAAVGVAGFVAIVVYIVQSGQGAAAAGPAAGGAAGAAVAARPGQRRLFRWNRRRPSFIRSMEFRKTPNYYPGRGWPWVGYGTRLSRPGYLKNFYRS